MCVNDTELFIGIHPPTSLHLFPPGFIVVAACVMTFEARDSAAKVVPARFKMLASEGSGAGSGSGRARNSSAIRRAATGRSPVTTIT